MEPNELVRDAIASLNKGNFRAASSVAKEIARLGGSMDGNYKEKVLERIQKLELPLAAIPLLNEIARGRIADRATPSTG